MPEVGSKEPTSIALTSIEVTQVLTSGSNTDEPAGELMVYAAEFTTYMMYLEVIGARPRQADAGTIEATVESLQRAEVCPYQDEETCRIDPYPCDWGVVRIDKIISYTPYAETSLASEEEGQAQSELPQRQTSPEYQGPESQPAKQKTEPLDEGQAVEALFLLTTRPTKVRYVPAGTSEGIESMEYTEPGAGDTVAHPVEPGKAVFIPIPRDGQYYVFTTKVGDYAVPIETILPGLEVGSRFRAKIRYDGILYVEEYELVP
jgi:hypothetical protein